MKMGHFPISEILPPPHPYRNFHSLSGWWWFFSATLTERNICRCPIGSFPPQIRVKLMWVFLWKIAFCTITVALLFFPWVMPLQSWRIFFAELLAKEKGFFLSSVQQGGLFVKTSPESSPSIVVHGVFSLIRNIHPWFHLTAGSTSFHHPPLKNPGVNHHLDHPNLHDLGFKMLKFSGVPSYNLNRMW